MGIYMLCFLGGTPFGSPVLGWLADVVSPRAPLVIGGVISLVAGVTGGLLLMTRHRHTVTGTAPVNRELV